MRLDKTDIECMKNAINSRMNGKCKIIIEKKFEGLTLRKCELITENGETKSLGVYDGLRELYSFLVAFNRGIDAAFYIYN